MAKHFKTAFAKNGDRLSVPDNIQADGSVSFDQGYGIDYERDQETDPQAKDIGRESFNGLFHDMTEAVGEIQSSGVAQWISGISYPKGALVWRNKVLHLSIVDANTSAPPSDKWTVLYDKSNTTVDKNNFIRAEGSKTTVVTDDITHDASETSKEKVASAELVSKKITGGNVVQTTGQSTVDVMSQKAVTDAVNAVKTTSSNRKNGWRKDPNTGLIEQWGAVLRTGTTTTVKFPIAFTKECFIVMLTLSQKGGSSASNISAENITTSGFSISAGYAESGFYFSVIGV